MYFSNIRGSVYAALPLEAVLANVLGVLIVAFGLVVLKILSNHEWQRPESGPEDLVYAVRICLLKKGYLILNRVFHNPFLTLSCSRCIKKNMNEVNLKKKCSPQTLSKQFDHHRSFPLTIQNICFACTNSYLNTVRIMQVVLGVNISLKFYLEF